MAHAHAATHHRSLGFTAFFMGVLATLIAAGATIVWIGAQQPMVRADVLPRADIAINLPDLRNPTPRANPEPGAQPAVQ